MNKLYFVFIAFALFCCACSQDDPPGDGGSEDPVFSMYIEEIDGDSAGLVAGKSGIYLFTDVKKDSSEVLVMNSLFSNVKCPDGSCEHSVEFSFRNNSMENFVMIDGLFLGNDSWEYGLKGMGLNLNTMAIHWSKPDGSVLYSDLISQPQDSAKYYFHIFDPVLYDPNEKGQTTLKMVVDFSCLMWDPAHVTVRNVKGNGVIGVAYQ